METFATGNFVDMCASILIFEFKIACGVPLANLWNDSITKWGQEGSAFGRSLCVPKNFNFAVANRIFFSPRRTVFRRFGRFIYLMNLSFFSSPRRTVFGRFWTVYLMIRSFFWFAEANYFWTFWTVI